MTTIGFGSVRRKEDARFIRGQGHYVDDVQLPRMLHGAVLRSPVAHARIVSIDTSAALQHPKVHAVITGADLEASGMAWMPTMSADRQAVLATDKVRFQGQEVAFVIADDRYSARDALELIDVDYELLAPVVDARLALEPDAPLIRDDEPGRIDNHIFDWEAGDAAATEAAFARADVVVEQEMQFPRSHPAPMETCGAVADFDRVCGKLTVWCTTQAPHAHRTLYSLVTGLAEHRIRVISPDVGGGFGNKVPVYPGYVCAIAAARLLGRPIKWMEDRSENLMSTGFARDFVMKGRIASTREGKLLAVSVDVIADHGAFNATAQPSRYPAGFFSVFTGSYDVSAAHCAVTGVYTNKAPGGVAYACSFRIAEAVYLVERCMDCLAARAGCRPGRAAAAEPAAARPVPVRVQDRLGLRLRRLRARDADGDGDRRLRRAACRAGGEAFARRADGDRRLVLHRGRRRRPAQAHGHVRAGDERRRLAADLAHRHRAALDQRAVPGPGPRDDVRADRLARARHPDRRRRRHPRRHRLDALRARDLRVALDARRAAPRRRWRRARCATGRGSSPARCSRSRPTISSGDRGRWAVVGDPSQGASIAEIAMAARGPIELPEGIEAGLDSEAVYDPPNLTFPFGAYICVVDIDPGTAHVKVRRFIAVDDCGVRINPMIVEGQIHGGLTDGVGMALMEMIAFDEEGNCLGGSLMDYLIPTAVEVPDWETGMTVTPSPHHPIGAKGVGESATVGSPPAIVNAICDALGVRHVDMPCTPSRVWDAMRGKGTPPQ